MSQMRGIGEIHVIDIDQLNIDDFFTLTTTNANLCLIGSCHFLPFSFQQLPSSSLGINGNVFEARLIAYTINVTATRTDYLQPFFAFETRLYRRDLSAIIHQSSVGSLR